MGTSSNTIRNLPCLLWSMLLCWCCICKIGMAEIPRTEIITVLVLLFSPLSRQIRSTLQFPSMFNLLPLLRKWMYFRNNLFLLSILIFLLVPSPCVSCCMSLSEWCVFSTDKSIQCGDLSLFVWEALRAMAEWMALHGHWWQLANALVHQKELNQWKCVLWPWVLQFWLIPAGPAVQSQHIAREDPEHKQLAHHLEKTPQDSCPEIGPCCLYAIVIEIK